MKRKQVLICGYNCIRASINGERQQLVIFRIRAFCHNRRYFKGFAREREILEENLPRISGDIPSTLSAKEWQSILFTLLCNKERMFFGLPHRRPAAVWNTALGARLQ